MPRRLLTGGIGSRVTGGSLKEQMLVGLGWRMLLHHPRVAPPPALTTPFVPAGDWLRQEGWGWVGGVHQCIRWGGNN